MIVIFTFSGMQGNFLKTRRLFYQKRVRVIKSNLDMHAQAPKVMIPNDRQNQKI
ncbi:hypothetical protein LCM08_01395 [Salipiger pacificus]|uniref:hypothetical protein n=1 Tax=Alloyangia mangrovi TaxID=1779329 RepID=UPI001596E19C|nr:hypothetical protein [Alloyangia mangrovi]MCA0939422.1 hypothetical protein [Alloyangia pacifica]MCA0943557.1 hypothetical protein [Alloyangia pacifica]